LRSDVAFVGRATAANDFDWQGLGLVTVEVATAFRRVFEALSDMLLHDTDVPDLTQLDQAIAKLQIVTDESVDNRRSPHSAIALPFVIDTLRRDLGAPSRGRRRLEHCAAIFSPMAIDRHIV